MSFTTVLRKAFPFISTALSLGGPMGVIASTLVGKAIGEDKPLPSTPEGMADILSTAFVDPTQRAAMLQAEQTFQMQMAELGYKHVEDLEATAAADRANARNREIQVKDWTPRVLAGLVVIFAAVGEGWVLTHGYPNNVAEGLVGRILGTLDSALILVLSYYFGSSAGSDRKTELLAEAPSVQK